jgi:GWxTD domain-containing protein
MNPYTATLGWSLLHFLWQGALAAFTLSMLLAAFRPKSAETRYGLALLTLVAMTIALLVTFLVLLPDAASTARALPGSRIILTNVALPSPDPFSSLAELYMPWFLAVWAAGSLLLALRAAGGWLRLQRLAKSARPGSCLVPGERLALRMGLGRGIRFLESAEVNTPVVFGWLKPVVLMPPAALCGLTPQQLESVLAHELAHLLRHDFAVNVLQTTAESLLFYHPAVWWVSSIIRSERELCCDDIAVAVCGDPIAYSKALLSLEESRAGLALAASGGSLAPRVRRLIGLPAEPAARSGGLIWAVTLALLLGIAGIGWTQDPPPAQIAPPAPAAPAAPTPAPPIPPKPSPLAPAAPPPPPAVRGVVGGVPGGVHGGVVGGVPGGVVGGVPAPPQLAKALAPPEAPEPPQPPEAVAPAPPPPPVPPDLGAAMDRAARDIERVHLELQRNQELLKKLDSAERQKALAQAQEQLARAQKDMERQMKVMEADIVRMNADKSIQALESAEVQKAMAEAQQQIAQSQKDIERQTKKMEADMAKLDADASPKVKAKELDRRTKYANEHFAEPNIEGSKSDRGRIYLRYGPPDSIDTTPNSKLIWHYRALQETGKDATFEFFLEGGFWRMKRGTINGV